MRRDFFKKFRFAGNQRVESRDLTRLDIFQIIVSMGRSAREIKESHFPLWRYGFATAA
jgi:hypothetical protein